MNRKTCETKVNKIARSTEKVDTAFLKLGKEITQRYKN